MIYPKRTANRWPSGRSYFLKFPGRDARAAGRDTRPAGRRAAGRFFFAGGRIFRAGIRDARAVMRGQGPRDIGAKTAEIRQFSKKSRKSAHGSGGAGKGHVSVK